MNAFEQGYQDFAKGNLINPYNKDTPKHRDWEFGFNKAFFRNAERVRENEARRGSQAIQSKEKV